MTEEQETQNETQQQAADVAHETNAEQQASRENFDPNVLAQVFERKTKTGGGAIRDRGDVIERNVWEFVLDGAQGTPNFFVDENGEYFDVKITVRSLSSSEEIQALQGLQDASQAPFMLAKACVYALNGKPLADAVQREFLWEGLGMRGRQLCLLAFNMIGGASQAALGKFQRSFSAV